MNLKIVNVERDAICRRREIENKDERKKEKIIGKNIGIMSYFLVVIEI